MNISSLFFKQFFLFLSIIIFAIGCGDGSLDMLGDNGGGASEDNGILLKLKLPKQLIGTKKTVNLSAYIVVDDTRFDLIVDSTTNEVNGKIKDFSPGEHNMTIFYTDGAVILASASQKVTLAVGDNNIIFASLERNYDEDKDGFTNLAEVRIGTNPADSSEVPLNGAKTKSKNYVATNSMVIPQFLATIVKSNNYEIKTTN